MPIITLIISGVIALILGILVLIWPKFLRYAVGFYLIITGILQLLESYGVSFSPI